MAWSSRPGRSTRCASPPAAHTLVRSRLLRPRQRLLSRVGLHQPRPHHLPGVDAAPRSRHGRRRRVPRLLAVAASSVTTATFTVRQDDGRLGGAAPARRDGLLVGIGLPSQAANLARRTSAPAGAGAGLRERHDRRQADAAPALDRRRGAGGHRGCRGLRPRDLRVLAPAGRGDVGAFLGAAQIDRHAPGHAR